MDVSAVVAVVGISLWSVIVSDCLPVSCSFLLLIECLLNFRPDQFLAVRADSTLEFIHDGLVVHVQQFSCCIDKFFTVF